MDRHGIAIGIFSLLVLFVIAFSVGHHFGKNAAMSDVDEVYSSSLEGVGLILNHIAAEDYCAAYLNEQYITDPDFRDAMNGIMADMDNYLREYE